MNKVNTKGHWPRADTARPTPSFILANQTAQHMDAYNMSILIFTMNVMPSYIISQKHYELPYYMMYSKRYYLQVILYY